MINTGIDKGVIQISDLINYLQSVKEQLGNMKICVNEEYIYDFEDSIELDEENNCICFIETI